MRRALGLWVVGFLFACGGPADPAAAIAAGDWKAVEKFLLDPNPATRAAAVTALASAQGADANRLLKDAALNSPNEDVFKAALPIILDRAVAGDSDAQATYKSAIASPQQEVQVEAIKTLQKKGAAAMKTFAPDFKQLLVDPDAPVVTAAVEAIKALGDDGWPVIMSALSDPLPSMRTAGAGTAAQLADLSKKHLDDISKQLVVESEAAVAGVLQKLLIDNAEASVKPFIVASNTVEDAAKREALIGTLQELVFYQKPDAKDPKKMVTDIRCPQLSASLDPLMTLGAKAGDQKKFNPYSVMIVSCGPNIGGNEKSADAKAIQEKLEKTSQDEKAELTIRHFSLYTLCHPNGGFKPSKDFAAWKKGAAKSEPDEKFKDILKKISC